MNDGTENPNVTTLLGRGSEFSGKLAFEGAVRIDGKFSGEIFTDDALIVGEGAEVNAEIHVGSIVIQGQVQGNITAKRSVEVHNPGRITGNVTTPSLVIERGVVFDGNCQMTSALSGETGRLRESSERPRKAEKAAGDKRPAETA